MIKRQLMTTTAAILISTAAFAQSNSKDVPSAAPSAQQTEKSTSTPQTSNPSTATSTQSQASPPPASSQTPSASTTTQTQQNTATDSARSTPNSTATNGTNANPSAGTQQPATASQSQPGQPAANQQQSTNPAPSTGTNQAQQTPSMGSSSNPSARQQGTQQSAGAGTGSDRANVSVQLNDTQRTRVSESVSHLNVKPLTNVNFSVSIGTAIPRDVRLQQLPADVVEIVPQYRGYNFVLVRDEIVIVDPSSYQIVATMPYSGRSTATAPAPREQRKVTFSDRDRETVRKHVRAAPAERRTTTTGSTVRTEIRRGERVPDGVEIEAFPEEVYRDAPTMREYRYIHRDSRTYIVEPQERRVIEEID
ncbi:DUF1236 domain-containing protein [Bradyrhizobium japonicum]|uniref:DUF1236 domain-containing protein n=1 Tax=Bradyrhizobium japonicum TaxID=375 RepID=UPI001BA73085|nr:DUF1236 domain-containing protein [Bradyrhizobium japonicum]MBR0989808.1 DUF1236 domain-containing protein [Bradyrhizobium japonicum]